MDLGEPHRALADLDRAIEIDPKPIRYLSRGMVYRSLGDYWKALEDYDRGEALDPEEWRDDAIGLHLQADCHARLGNEAAALACGARLPDHYWTPGVHDAPAGDKAEIAAELRRLAAAARSKGT